MDHDLDHLAGMDEFCMSTACRAYRDRAAEAPFARRFSLEEVDQAIQDLKDARLSIVQAQQQKAAA